jgi:hypothetical protein
MPVTTSLNSSWGGAGHQHQHLTLTIEALMEFPKQHSPSPSGCSAYGTETTSFPLLFIGMLLTIFALLVARISAVITRQVKILQLKIDKLQNTASREVSSKNERAKHQKHTEHDHEGGGLTRAMKNGDCTEMIEVIVFSPGESEGLAIEVFSDSP